MNRTVLEELSEVVGAAAVAAVAAAAAAVVDDVVKVVVVVVVVAADDDGLAFGRLALNLAGDLSLDSLNQGDADRCCCSD